MSELNVTEMMKEIPKYFNPIKVAGVTGIVQSIFTGQQASNWVITIKNETCQVREDMAATPDLTIRADAEDGVKLLTGQLDAMCAYMLGKIKVTGDLALGMKLINFFD